MNANLRGEISYIVLYLSENEIAPTKRDHRKAKKVVLYLKRTNNSEIQIQNMVTISLTVILLVKRSIKRAFEKFLFI